MNGSDRSKLVRLGVRIMRADKNNKTITEMNKSGGWNLVGRFPTLAKMNLEIKNLRAESELTIFECED